MSPSIPAMIEAQVSKHIWDKLVIVHRILGIRQPKFPELLGDYSFPEVSRLPALPFSLAGP